MPIDNPFWTEAIYLIFTVFLQLIIAEPTYPPQDRKKQLPLLIAYGLLASSVLFVVNRFDFYAFFAYIVLSFSFTLFWFIGLHPGFNFHKLLTGIISCAVIVMCKSLISSLFIINAWINTLIMILLDLFMAWIIVRNKFDEEKQVKMKNSPYAWISVLLVTVSVSGILSIFYKMRSFNMSGNDWMFPLFFIVTELMVYVMLTKVTNEYNSRLYYSALLEQQRYQSNLSSMHLEKQEEIRLIRHEIKNKVFYMKELIERNDYEKLKEYISEEFSFPDTEREFITGNGILDGVLSFKQHEAEKKDIRFTVSSSPVTTEGIEDKDITALLFNLLDNAMHAQEHVTNGWINVEIKMIKGYLSFRIENSTADNVMKNNPGLTSKREGHGLGLRIIRSIVEKYNGMVNFISGEDSFCAEIMLMIRAAEHPQ